MMQRLAAISIAGALTCAAASTNFLRDVAPILNKGGCTSGPCHGSAKGKNGFKLSLRGYDPQFDYEALLYDLSGRRFNRADPGKLAGIARNRRMVRPLDRSHDIEPAILSGQRNQPLPHSSTRACNGDVDHFRSNVVAVCWRMDSCPWSVVSGQLSGHWSGSQWRPASRS